MRWFGREPAVITAAAVTTLQGLSLLLGLQPDAQGYLNAAVLAAGGIATAIGLHSLDGVLPAALGLIKAGFALVLALGMQLPDSYQVAALTVVTALLAMFVRQNVTAAVPPPAAYRYVPLTAPTHQ